MQPPGGIVPAGALPDIVPGAQAPDMPRLHLIREEQAVQAAAAGSCQIFYLQNFSLQVYSSLIILFHSTGIQ